MKVKAFICSIFGHKPKTIKVWRDNSSGFIRATEKCTRCEYTYDWEPFFATPEGVKHFTSLEELKRL